MSCDLGHSALAPFTLTDISQKYVDWLNDPEVMHYTRAGSMKHTLASARAYVKAAAADKTSRLFKILLDGAHVGNIRISNLDEINCRAEIAIIVGEKKKWGRGIAPMAIDLAAQYAFRRLKLHKLVAVVLEPNKASRRAFLKAGFVDEGTLRAHYRMGKGYVDAIFMARFSKASNRA